MDSPAAEVAIDVALIEALVRSQHPDLAGAVRIVADGWDNVVARLGNGLAVRLPRRAIAAPLIENEAVWLPRLAPLLPVPVPAAVRVGVPAHGYPFGWLICPWFEGYPVTALDVADRRRIATDLGAAHVALHRPAPTDAPRNPVRGGPLASRDTAVEERIASGLPRAAELRASWRRALDVSEWDGPPLWLHGDPHPGNLLADIRGPDARLAAIIDFGDITAGDPATDLAIAWLAFDAEGRAAYRTALGPLDEATWARAHGWAVAMTTMLLASSDDRAEMAAIGRHALEQVLSDPPL